MAAAASSRTVPRTRSRRAKRVRTEVADPPQVLSGHPNNWRDWVNLTAGPAGLIAEEVLADDVADYLRFRAACNSWRRCTPSPHAHDGLDRRFHPRRWIMLPEAFADRISRRDFLNVSTGERIQVDLPQLQHHFVFGPTSDGLINPLTRQLTALPNATSLLKRQNIRWRSSTGLRILKKLKGFSVGVADGSTVAMHFNNQDIELAVARPNDDARWSCRARSEWDSIISTLPFANHFYCVTMKGIKVLHVTTVDQKPQLVLAVEGAEDFRWLHRRQFLVDNDGELIMVRPDARTIMEFYEAYRVDLDTGKMVPIYDLRGRAVFVCHNSPGRGRSVSVDARLFSSIRANTIYRCIDDGRADARPRIDVCHVKKGWIKHDLCPQKGSIVDY